MAAPRSREKSVGTLREFRFSGWAGGNSDLVAAPRSGENLGFALGGISDSVARLKEIQV